MVARDSALSQLAYELRASGPVTLKALLGAAVERGIPVTHAHVQSFIKESRDRRTGELYVPDVLPALVAEALASRAVESIIDPWSGIGSYLDQVAMAVGARSVVAISPSPDDCETGEILSQHGSTQRFVGEPIEHLAKIPGRFDAVVCAPPWGIGGDRETAIEHAGKTVAVRGDLGFQVFLTACSLLKDDGAGFCVVSPRFFFDGRKHNARAAMSDLGLCLDAAFYLPPRTFAPFTAAPGYLIVATPQLRGDLFVAELASHTDVKRLVDSWRRRRPGKRARLGAVTDPKVFRSLDHLEHTASMVSYARENGLEVTRLMDVTLELKRENTKIEAGFEDKPNTVYLPLIGNSAAVNRLSELQIKPQNYAQIVLDENKVFAEYVARFFNSEIGRSVRDSLLRGIHIPKISLASLREAVICTPPLDTQMALVEVGSSIADLRAELTSLERRLWERPRSVGRVRRDLRNLGKDRGTDAWIESLPFPLASILVRYAATGDVRLKEDHLLHFFEALAQFVTTVMLSAIGQDDGAMEKHRADLFDEKGAEALRRSSFGGWCVFGAKLAKITRTGMSAGGDDLKRFLRLYGRQTPDFIESLVSKGLHGVLQKTCECRNAWRGHGGVESVSVARQRVVQLESELARVREVIGDAFEGSIMCRPGPATYAEGMFANTVKSLMGGNPVFRDVRLETTVPMDADALYLVENDHPEPLRLLPLVRMGPTPGSEEQACYFYNRIEGDGIRWVSYHFEQEAEIVDQGGGLRETLEELALGSEGQG